MNRHSQYITIEKQTYLRISSRHSLALVLVRFIVTSYNTAADLFSFITFYLQASSLGLGSIELNNTALQSWTCVLLWVGHWVLATTSLLFCRYNINGLENMLWLDWAGGGCETSDSHNFRSQLTGVCWSVFNQITRRRESATVSCLASISQAAMMSEI